MGANVCKHNKTGANTYELNTSNHSIEQNMKTERILFFQRKITNKAIRFTAISRYRSPECIFNIDTLHELCRFLEKVSFIFCVSFLFNVILLKTLDLARRTADFASPQ